VLRLVSITLLLAACDPAPSWLDHPEEPLPAELSELGIYPSPGERTRVHPRAITFEPIYPLWSNGSEKQRLLVLPEGATIDATDRTAWEFPIGTTFFKTFSYGDRPIETRVIHLNDSGWEFAVYAWDDDGSGASLLDGALATPVEVTYDGETFDHQIPSTRQCRVCHEANDTIIIGFDELRLSADQLARLYEDGVIDGEPPAEQESISAADETTREVLGYLHGNCSHCHNGTEGPTGVFSLRHQVALENMIGRETEASGSEAGIRVVPGDPDTSVLFRAFSGASAMQMPPVGVQHRDAAAIELLRGWITELRTP
jgi:hypothetical protein